MPMPCSNWPRNKVWWTWSRPISPPSRPPWRPAPTLPGLVKSPLFSHEDQARALKPVLEKMGVNALTVKFLLTLTGKRRLFALANVIAAYGRLVARLKGEVEAEVTSAHALTAAQTAELKSVLKSKLGREPAWTRMSIPACLAAWSSRWARA